MVTAVIASGAKQSLSCACPRGGDCLGSSAMTDASKHPQRVGRKLDLMLALADLRGGVDPYREAAAREQQLPALAQIHLRLQLHRDAVRAGAVGETDALDPDHAGRLRA